MKIYSKIVVAMVAMLWGVATLPAAAQEEGFTKQSKIADFASEYFCEELGTAGIGSRAAVGVASLPGDAPVEISIIAGAGSR